MKTRTKVGLVAVLVSLPCVGFAETGVNPSASVSSEPMSLGERVQHDRVVVISEGSMAGQLRVRGAIGPAYDIRLPAGTMVVGADGTSRTMVSPGDVVRVDRAERGPVRVYLLRPGWRELSSPEQ